MKLYELDAQRLKKQVAKVFESHMETRLDFGRIDATQARSMLGKVRNLIGEHRNSPSFHYSERNPDYMKLVMMEQALVDVMREQGSTGSVPGAATTTTPGTPTAGTVDPKKQAALQASQIQQKKRDIQDAIRNKQKEISDLQKMQNNPTMMTMAENKRLRRLSESEVQQAQVVLAAQDMVDQVQKMLEQISEMQFKDLPALVDSIKNDPNMGMDQATKFQADATAALTTLLGSVQAGKTQLETAQGVLTGQAPQVPGLDTGDMPPVDANVDVDADLELDADPVDDEEDVAPTVSLGRERR